MNKPLGKSDSPVEAVAVNTKFVPRTDPKAPQPDWETLVQSAFERFPKTLARLAE